MTPRKKIISVIIASFIVYLILFADLRLIFSDLFTAIKQSNHKPVINESSELIKTVREGNLAETRVLLERGADINEREAASQSTPLLIAEGRNNIEMARLLIEKGADIDAKDYGGDTALINAAILNHIDMAKLLIANGADIEAKDKWERTALIRAAGEGRPEIVSLLLEKGAVINSKNKRNWTAIMEALSRQQFAIAKLLLAHNGLLKEDFGPSTLMVAARFGTDEIVEQLLLAGVDVNSNDNYGETALLVASQFTKPSIMELLIKKGADVNAKNSHGETALIKVASELNQNTLRAAQILVDHGVNINAKDNIGWTALIRAAKRRNNDIVKFLLSKGAIPDDAQNIGSSALEIVEPKEGQTFEAGARIHLLIKPKPGEKWKMLMLASALPDAFPLITYSFWHKAYTKDISIPKEWTPQKIEISVLASSKDDLTVWLKRQVNIVLPRNILLKGISVDPNPVFLYKLPPNSAPNDIRIFETKSIGVGGMYSDGIERNITAPSVGTTYTSSNENIAKISPDGEITARGIGEAIVTVRNGNYTTQAKVKVTAYKDP